ncbi:hypothetical protein [Terrabacter sp. Ter38]|uniref:hypothetical protein n=1 Tax=Terrabacter sp. Ter38 TaxID=2926030 RepID=UPI00211833CC|nr:hypothetical protein [Terrabacter sp. Ter38]
MARTMVFAAALGMGLTLVTLGTWDASGASPLGTKNASHASSARTGLEKDGEGVNGGPGDPTSTGLADRLRRMDPKALDTSVAREDAGGGRTRAQGTSTKTAWFVGDVGTYLVGRGIPPGRYESVGSRDGRICRWSVIGADGVPTRSGSSSTRTIVTLDKDAGFFQSKDCANWHAIS